MKPKTLKQFREERNVKASDVANAIGIDNSHWYRIETDDNWFPGMKTMVKIAKYFNISLDDLAMLMGFDIPHKKIIVKKENEVILEMTDFNICYRAPYKIEVYYYDDEKVYKNERLKVQRVRKDKLNEK